MATRSATIVLLLLVTSALAADASCAADCLMGGDGAAVWGGEECEGSTVVECCVGSSCNGGTCS